MKDLLTLREQQILYLIVDEYTTGEIARQINLDFETIRTHRKNLMTKLGARNVAGLVRRAFEYGIVPISTP
jgi:DNA-binding CsgD family transcriptional regulator